MSRLSTGNRRRGDAHRGRHGHGGNPSTTSFGHGRARRRGAARHRTHRLLLRPDKRCVDRDSYTLAKGYKVVADKNCKSSKSTSNGVWYYGGKKQGSWVDGGSLGKPGKGSGGSGGSSSGGGAGVDRGGFGGDGDGGSHKGSSGG